MVIKNVVIVGAGAMGSDIAQIAIMAGYNVSLVDIKDEFVQKGLARIQKGLEKVEAKGKLMGNTAASLIQTVILDTDLASAVKNADFVLEAVIENLDVKKQVFQTLGQNTPDHCIMASNTSSMSISEIAEASGRPNQVCGIHFFNPAPLMRLVEVIKGEKTDQPTLEAASRWAYSLPCLRGKRFVPLVLKDRPGFIANRIQAPVGIYISWALDYCNEHDIPFEQLDTDVFTPISPMSPLILYDYVGLDINYHTALYYAKTLHPDFAPGIVLTDYVQRGELGLKTGKGLFEWKNGKPPILDRTYSANLIDLETIAAIQANEGCRLLEEGVVKDWSTIDETILAGFNSPGPMVFFVDGNREKWVSLLEDLAKRTGKSYLLPCDLMKSSKYREMQYLP